MTRKVLNSDNFSAVSYKKEVRMSICRETTNEKTVLEDQIIDI